MIKDISFGQYVAGNSLMHRLDARSKLFALVVYLAMLFFGAKNLYALLLCVVLVAVLYATGGIPIKMIAKSLKPIMPIIIFTTLLNMLFLDGEVLWKWRFITITREGLYFSLIISVRIICMLAATTLLTYTTSPMQLTDALECISRPLAKIGFPSHELAMMMTITLRFIPTLIEETDRIMCAQKSRGALLDTGGLVQRIKAMVPILVPLFVSAFRRADDLALAMECRCYRGGEGRTQLNTPRMRAADFVFMAVISLLCAAVFVSNSFFETVI